MVWGSISYCLSLLLHPLPAFMYLLLEQRPNKWKYHFLRRCKVFLYPSLCQGFQTNYDNSFFILVVTHIQRSFICANPPFCRGCCCLFVFFTYASFVQYEFTQNQFLLKRCSDKTTLIISGDFSCWGTFQYTLGASLLGVLYFFLVKLLSLWLQFRSGTSFWVFEALAVIPDSDLVVPGSGSIPPITFIEIDKIPQRQSWSPSSSFSSSPPSSQRSQNQLKQQGFVTRLYVYSFSGLLGGKSVSPFFPEVS